MCLKGDETYNGLLVTKMHLEREEVEERGGGAYSDVSDV